MVIPETGETLYLYIVVSNVSVSVALFKEDEQQKQRPIFYISKSLPEVETQYILLDQAALALKVAAKKTPPLLPGAPYHCTHQPPPKEHHTQAQSIGADDSVGG